VHTSPILHPISHQNLGFVLIIDDITEMRRLEKIRSEFVANVSHELRTPLTSIRGFIETLRNGAIENPEARDKFLDIIAHSF
jgi:two-component system phosphate regulon sensor histidine kinase PhoR